MPTKTGSPIDTEINRLQALIDEHEPLLAEATATIECAGAERNELSAKQKTKDRIDTATYHERMAGYDAVIQAANRQASESNRIVAGDVLSGGARRELRRLQGLSSEMEADAPLTDLEAAVHTATARQREINDETAQQHVRREAAITSGDGPELVAANQRLRELQAEAQFARRTTLHAEAALLEGRHAATAAEVWAADRTLEAAQEAVTKAETDLTRAQQAHRIIAETRNRLDRQAQAARVAVTAIETDLARTGAPT